MNVYSRPTETRPTLRPRPFRAATLVLAAAVACGLSEVVAPEGSTITVVANPSVIAIDGDSAIVSAVLLEADGDLVVDSTVVLFSTTLGSVCPLAAPSSTTASCDQRPAAEARTANGIASVVFRSTNLSGGATVTATSGKVSGTAAIEVSGLIAPIGGSAQLSSTSDSVAKDVGRMTLTAFLADSTGKPVRDRTRAVFSASSGSLHPIIALTTNGFAQTELRNVARAGADTIRLISGSVRDSLVITVVP